MPPDFAKGPMGANLLPVESHGLWPHLSVDLCNAQLPFPRITYPAKLTDGYYRVRKAWSDKKSQLGAYRVLAYAKAKADNNPGYYVFDPTGKAIYPSEKYRLHTVVKGDSLWNIAKKYLGNGSRYPEIKELNGLTSNIIYSGWKLKIPN